MGKISILIFLCMSILLSSCFISVTSPPKFWYSQRLFNNRADEMWKVLSTNGRLDFQKLYKFLGNQHSPDGDSEFKAALIIFSAPDDPYEYLLESLQADDLSRNVFAIQLISHLKDKRFRNELEKIENESVINCFHAKTLKSLAKYTLSTINMKSELCDDQFKQYAAVWLVDSWEKD